MLISLSTIGVQFTEAHIGQQIIRVKPEGGLYGDRSFMPNHLQTWQQLGEKVANIASIYLSKVVLKGINGKQIEVSVPEYGKQWFEPNGGEWTTLEKVSEFIQQNQEELNSLIKLYEDYENDEKAHTGGIVIFENIPDSLETYKKYKAAQASYAEQGFFF